MLWIYFQDVEKLYPLSLRGAQEVCTLFAELESEDRDVRAAAAETLTAIARRMKLDEATCRYTLGTVKEDPYAKFLFSIWS